MACPDVDQLVGHVVDASHDGYWIIDPDGWIRYANASAARILGRSREELVTLNVSDLLDEQGREQFLRHLADLRARGTNSRDVECRYRTPDGQVVRVLVGESAIQDDGGDTVAYAHRMVSDSLRLEMLDELTRSRALLADAQSIARLGSWEIDETTGEVTWSSQIYEVLALDPATTTPSLETFFGMLHHDDRHRVEKEYDEVRCHPAERSIEARLVLGDDTVRWVRVIGRVLSWAADGSAERVGGTVQDIHEAKETELRLRDAVVLNSLMQFMSAAMNQAATLHDALVKLRELLLEHWDWKAAVAFEVGPEATELVVVPVEGAEQATELERRVALQALDEGDVVLEETATPQTPSIGFPVMLDDRPRIVCVITATSPFERQPMLRAMAQQVAAQLGTVAAREAAASSLALARDHAEQASRAKTEFVATMSHEIRTPLNGVIGLNDLMLRTELDDRQRRLAEGVQGAGRSLLNLLNDILDFSKIEAGVVELEQISFEPRTVVEEAVGLFRHEADDRDNQLVATVAGNVPDSVVGDPGRFRQILSNLVSNAVKFTSAGVISVTVTAAEEDDHVELRAEVRDTGIGMDSEQLSRVFDPFQQADVSTARDYGGTGLGLTIARQLVVALGGDMGSSSAPGAGSVFWFTVPCERTVAGAVTAADLPRPSVPGPTGRVLVVEDNEVNQLVALGMLEALGYAADVAVDGAEGARRALSSTYDAVLMDLRMPGTDGYEGTSLIRSQEGVGGRVPIIALTASATDGERERCQAAGMDGFLTKPIALAHLEAELRRCISGAPVALEPTPASMGQGETAAVLDPGRLEELAEMGEGAAPLVRRAVDNFVDRAGDEVSRLHDLVGTGDADGLRMVAHRLKGSAANLGLVQVAELAFSFEESAPCLAATGDDADVVLAPLATALERGITALRGTSAVLLGG